jgi:hypothetical protein
MEGNSRRDGKKECISCETEDHVGYQGKDI